MKSFKSIYDFRKDNEFIEFVSVRVFGNKSRNQPIDGLIPGTIEWFAKIDAEQIPLYKVQGVISRVYMTGHNDWPEFEIDSDGVKTGWTRMGNDTEYIVGR